MQHFRILWMGLWRWAFSTQCTGWCICCSLLPWFGISLLEQVFLSLSCDLLHLYQFVRECYLAYYKLVIPPFGLECLQHFQSIWITLYKDYDAILEDFSLVCVCARACVRSIECWKTSFWCKHRAPLITLFLGKCPPNQNKCYILRPNKPEQSSKNPKFDIFSTMMIHFLRTSTITIQHHFYCMPITIYLSIVVNNIVKFVLSLYLLYLVSI